jgi:hypothetical protein
MLLCQSLCHAEKGEKLAGLPVNGEWQVTSGGLKKAIDTAWQFKEGINQSLPIAY